MKVTAVKDMVNAVQILHQHKNTVIYSKPIIRDTPSIVTDRNGIYLAFETLLFGDEPNFVERWVQSNTYVRVTERIMRFVNNDTVVYQLPKKTISARLFFDETEHIIYICVYLKVTKAEALELAKLFRIKCE